jgi:hypothetical protein
MAFPEVAAPAFRRAEADAEHTDLCGDVLQFRLAEVVHLQRHFAGRVLAYTGLNADAARFRQRFQPRRDDHAIAQQVVTL